MSLIIAIVLIILVFAVVALVRSREWWNMTDLERRTIRWWSGRRRQLAPEDQHRRCWRCEGILSPERKIDIQTGVSFMQLVCLSCGQLAPEDRHLIGVLAEVCDIIKRSGERELTGEKYAA